MFDSVSNPEVTFKLQNSFNELTVFVNLRLVKIADRVLLDSVSFSRIMSLAQGAFVSVLLAAT